MQNADGTVLIRAELDHAAVTDGIVQMRAVLEDMRRWAAQQCRAMRDSAVSEGEAAAGGMSGVASAIITSLHRGTITFARQKIPKSTAN